MIPYECPIDKQIKAIVGVTTFAAQRYAPNFTFADSFIPERWLNASHACYTPDPSDPEFVENTFSSDQRGAHQPFAVGARNCIGMNLAMAEMRLILALFVWHFDISSPAGTEPLIWETQKTYNNWWRSPMDVVISVANPTTV
jgi:cytochrome P450